MKKIEYSEAFIYSILIALVLYLFINSYILADTFTKTELERLGKGYVSDEVWYVSSARNILEKVFKLKPRFLGEYTATIVYSDEIDSFILSGIAEQSHVTIVDNSYTKLKYAVYVSAKNTASINKFIEKLREHTTVKDIVWGWRLPDAENVNEYLNLEHPPLVKYFIAISMYFLGDYPTFWRIPSIIAGALLVLLSYMVAKAITRNKYISLIISAFVASEPFTRLMASIALLDIYVALFSVAIAYFIVKKKYKYALLLIGLGSTVKFNTLFMVIPYLITVIRDDVRKDPRPITLVSSIIANAYIVVAIVIIFQVVVSIPLILHVGLNNWLNSSIFGAIKWHTSVKCIGESCPTPSAPWDWFLGVNSFPIYFFPTGESLYAQGMSIFWTISLVYSILFLPSYIFSRKIRLSILFMHGILLGYLLLWIIGGRTQYSFYSIQLLPFTYINLVVVSKEMLLNRENGLYTLGLWRSLGSYIWKIILKICLIKDTE